MYRLRLRLRGFSVDLARDGEDGLARILSGDLPDVLVVDLGLPRIERNQPRRDALDMLSVLRSVHLTNTVPVVALSCDGAGLSDALDRGATECMSNWQTTPRNLAHKVAQLLGEPVVR